MDEIKRAIFSNMLLVAGVILIGAFAFYLGITTANTESLRALTTMAIKDNSVSEDAGDFSTYTKSSCYNTSTQQVCHDIVYARCDGKEYEVLPINPPNNNSNKSKN